MDSKLDPKLYQDLNGHDHLAHARRAALALAAAARMKDEAAWMVCAVLISPTRTYFRGVQSPPKTASMAQLSEPRWRIHRHFAESDSKGQRGCTWPFV